MAWGKSKEPKEWFRGWESSLSRRRDGTLESQYLAPLASSEAKGSLIVRDAAVAFGGVKAVDGVSFEIPAGGVTGLIGSNGAGKTTLFNAITGHVKGATGQFILDGEEISQKPIHNRALSGLGGTFQNLNLHDDLNARARIIGTRPKYEIWANSRIFPDALGTSRRKNAHYVAAELLDHMDLLEYWNEKVEDLPYGLQKRVDVVRALATNPNSSTR